MFGIARNAALDELRRRKRGPTLADDPEDAARPAADEEAELALRRDRRARRARRARRPASARSSR